ncbi:hypothetical protein BASA50_007253 [Batrachochytrium salamandrivorans]|uniref:Uncharacterized protein n=1 Tax=Batrachochytrium salamandrivorans TaxID=1357716 RepID=A0ABQ8FAG6_9FUNG|nr:hypothetical protein BASA61_009174 [Batrachochytrium salamandrivorans]KAH6593584.1 hypothetical protein BASA50_007253 [Batrachochytrium salamandrivorans]KAJ1330016.1 hypothetical protein BSLG_009804 [Batrachochytrium salamandrivorans]
MIFAYVAIIPALIVSVHAAVIPITLNGQNLSALRKRAGEDDQRSGSGPQESGDRPQGSPTAQSRPTPTLRLRSGDKKILDKIDDKIANHDQRVGAEQKLRDQKRKEKYDWELMLTNADKKFNLKKDSAIKSARLKVKSKITIMDRKREREMKKENPRQKILKKLDKDQRELIKDMTTSLQKTLSSLSSKLANLKNRIRKRRNTMEQKWDLQDMKKDAKEKYRKKELERKRQLASDKAEIRARDRNVKINGSILDMIKRMVENARSRIRKGKTDES